MFGKELSQEIIKDENNFIFHEQDWDKPISSFSNKCRLNLTFAHINRYAEIVNINK